MRASLPAPASLAGTPHRPSAAAPRVPAGEKPVTSAQLRTQVRPPRVPILSGSAFQGATERLGGGGGSGGSRAQLSLSLDASLQLNSVRSALVEKVTSLWKEPGRLDRPCTQVTSLQTLIPELHSPELAQPGPPGGPWGSCACRLPRSLPSFLSQG